MTPPAPPAPIPAPPRTQSLPLWAGTGAVLVADLLAALVIGFPDYPTIEIEPIAPHALFPVGRFTITHSIVTTWFSGTVIVVLAVVLTRGLRLIPNPVQNAVEWIYESLANFVVSLGGPQAKR